MDYPASSRRHSYFNSPKFLFVALINLIRLVFRVYESFGGIAAAAAMPFFYFVFVALPSLILVMVLKKALIGKYKSGVHPMWSWFVWRSEAITATYEACTVGLFLAPLTGTPFLPFFLRQLGVTIGKNCFIDSSDFTELD